MVEAAFALPVLFSFVMALIDFGYLEMRTSQLSSAARDGARTGIVHYANADQGGTYSPGGGCSGGPSDFAIVCNAAVARMTGSKFNTNGVTVVCKEGLSATDKVGGCAAAVTGIDSIKVTVTQTYNPLTIVGQTFLGTARNYSFTAQMVVQ